MTDTFLCPRRDEIAGSMFKLPESDHWREDGTCSHCGSISSTAFFEAIAGGRKLTPTDKNYKVYVDLPSNSMAKFYFQHLTDDEKKRFIDLLNAKTVKLAYPGYFYSLPYFIQRPPPTAANDT